MNGDCYFLLWEFSSKSGTVNSTNKGNKQMVKILLIEDEELVRENVLELLDAEGFETCCADNGRVGINIAQQENPDLILCDVMMPELDGYGVLEQVRQNPQTVTIPFIFLTAKAAKGDFRAGMELGADDYLTKPFTRAELLGAVGSQLRKKAAIAARYQSEINKTKLELEHKIRHDSLTGLPNRLSLRENFADILNSRQDEGQNTSVIPVMCLCLDRFKIIKENLDSLYSELLLKEVAQRLTSCTHQSDTIAYLSENRYALILPTADSQSLATERGQEIIHALSQPFQLNDQEVFVSGSIGISLYPNHGDGIEDLLICANRAMDYSSQNGGNQVQFDAPTLKVGSSERLALETGLRYVLEREELQVYYQPRVCLKSGSIVGAEALVRWFNPERGMVSPGQFIPIAEESGLIVPISEWIYRTACEQLKIWQSKYAQDLVIAVNLSSRQFVEPNLREHLETILQETQLDPKYLELELTEGMLVQNPPLAKQKLEALNLLGIKIAIDDFGTGYSSLSYLQQFPFEILKIDQCFVRNLTEDATNAAITIAIMQMAHSLNFRVIAEGVETEAELAFLRQHPCDEIQGYFFSPPLPAHKFEELLSTGKIMD